MSNQTEVHIRWLIRRDMDEVLAIEKSCFEFPWTEENFLKTMRQRNCIGMVAWDEVKGVVAGFMIYELHKIAIHVLNFAVHPEYQRRGVGTHMVAKLLLKLSLNRRSQLLLEVRESNVAAQCFFRAKGFRAVRILRDFYEDTTEDAYVMRFHVRQVAKVSAPGPVV